MFLGLAFLIQNTAILLLKLFPKKKNPYIEFHKLKENNDKNYDAYLEWLQIKGEGVPIEKVQTKEDKKAESKIRRLF